MWSNIKKFISQFFLNPKLQIHILSLFLTLLITSVVFILAYTYLRNKSAILGFSKGTIERVSEVIKAKLVCNLLDLQQLPKLTEAMVTDYHDISLDNKKLTTFMLMAVKTYPNLHAFFIATPDGNLMVATDRSMVVRDHYLSDPSKPLPKEFAFAIRQINHQKNQEIWLYKDKAFKTLVDETVSSEIDFRTLAPYKGASRTGDIYWSEVYENPFSSQGIAVASPVYQQDHQLIAVIGAVLPLRTISDILSKLQISKRGKAFVVESSGKILLPENSEGSSALVAKAYQIFQQKHDDNFLLEENGQTYLMDVHPFPLDVQTGWFIVVTAPLDDFFGQVLQTLKETVFISLGLLLLSSALVYYFAKRISKPIFQLAQEIDKIKRLDLQSEQRVNSYIQEINLLDDAIASMRTVLRSFGHYVPKEIVKQLMEKGKEIGIGGEKKNLAILFSDIIGFTPIAESLPIDIFMPSLEDYFDKVSKIILEAQGTIDKYIGDSVMAFWGAPTDIEHPEVYACTAALRCHVALAHFNQEQKKWENQNFLPALASTQEK